MPLLSGCKYCSFNNPYIWRLKREELMEYYVDCHRRNKGFGELGCVESCNTGASASATFASAGAMNRTAGTITATLAEAASECAALQARLVSLCALFDWSADSNGRLSEGSGGRSGAVLPLADLCMMVFREVCSSTRASQETRTSRCAT